jgi:hypothetical protein
MGTMRGTVSGLSKASPTTIFGPQRTVPILRSPTRAATEARALWDVSRQPVPERGTPAELFQNGEEGFWLDATDLSTMFEDVDGTIPITGLERPVLLWLDKSGNNNHFRGVSTSTTLSARYNVLNNTEAFSAPAPPNAFTWSVTNASITPDATLAPTNTGVTADLYTQNASPGAAVLQQRHDFSPQPTGAVGALLSFYVKPVTGSIIALRAFNSFSAGAVTVWFDLVNQTVSAPDLVSPATHIASSVNALPDGWFRITMAYDAVPANGTTAQLFIADATSSTTRLGNGSCYIWGADLRRYTLAATNIPNYQRVDQDGYDSVGFPYFVQTTNQSVPFLSGRPFDFSRVMETTVIIAVRRGATNGNKGTAFLVNVLGGANFQMRSNSFTGTTSAPGWTSAGQSITSPTEIAMDVPYVVTGLAKIIDDFSELRVNGSSVGTNTGDQGALPYTVNTGTVNLPSGGAILVGGFNQMIVRGKYTQPEQLERVEQWVAARSAAY